MPTTFTTAYYDTQKPTRTNTSRNAAPNVISAETQFLTVSYTLVASEVDTDIIRLAILPAGVVPIPQESCVVCSADPASDVVEPEATGVLQIDIGTASNADGWADGIDLSAGGKVLCTAGTIPAWLAGTPLVADSGSGNAIVYATIATTTGLLTAGALLHFVLAYKRGR